MSDAATGVTDPVSQTSSTDHKEPQEGKSLPVPAATVAAAVSAEQSPAKEQSSSDSSSSTGNSPRASGERERYSRNRDRGDRGDRGERGDRMGRGGFSRSMPSRRTSGGNSGPTTNTDGTPLATQLITGFIDLTSDGHAVVRRGFSQSRDDAYLSISVLRKLGLRGGDFVEGMAREPRENDRYWGMLDITKVNGVEVDKLGKRRRFEDQTPVYPDSKIVLEYGPEPISNRLIDLVAPIGKGQRGLIVAPPKAGKTSIMKEMMSGIAQNYPEVHLMGVLIGERPEEVTDIRRHVDHITSGKGEVAASNFDEPALEQTRVAEVALERAKRLVEDGRDVVILLDSITRLARAYNLAIPTSGRTLSGGFDPAALYPPKRFFGAARNFEGTGSLTIIGTALIDTGSRMDDLVYEEFKGTGNMELHLDRRLAERRIFPAINVQRSGTRRDDLLFTPQEYQSVLVLHRMLDMLGDDERSEIVLRRLRETKDNKQFLASLKEG